MSALASLLAALSYVVVMVLVSDLLDRLTDRG